MPDANVQLRPGLFRAEATLRVVEGFVRAFDEPGGPEQLRALLDGKRFRRTLRGEDPRAVAVEHLVRPCLQALGYAEPGANPGPASPRFRPHPGRLPERDGAGGRAAASSGRQMASDGRASADAIDFELATPVRRGDPALAGVVAVAPPNAERAAAGSGPATAGRAGSGPAGAVARPAGDDPGPATAAVREYLADDAVADRVHEGWPVRDERGNGDGQESDSDGRGESAGRTESDGSDPPVLAGVATDGLHWSAWARSPDPDAAVRHVGSVTVKGVVETVADALVLDGDPPARWRVHARRDVDGTLASLAACEHLPSRACETIENCAG